MPPRWPAVITPAPPPGRGRHAPGDSPHPSAPTGQPPCCVTPNTPLADWSIPPALLHDPRLLAPLAAARAPPTKATQPTGSPSFPLPALPSKGSPCGTTVQPAGCLAWAIPPGRGPRPPPRGQA
jgi:hypothetical protein